MKHGKDEGAGAWVITQDGTTTVSEYMIARHKEWVKRIRNGDGGLSDAALFAAEMGKILQAFGEVLPRWRYLEARDEADADQL